MPSCATSKSEALRLHVLTHADNAYGRSHYDLAKLAMQGGADVIQYREKKFERTRHLQELEDILALRKEYPQTKVIINDWLDLALEVEADGVHLGQEDPTIERATRQLPPHAILGATVHNQHELEYARQYPVTYIGVGPVFGSGSKNLKLPPLTPEGLHSIAISTNLPTIGIGNINTSNAPQVLEAGASGVAIVSSFCNAEDPVRTLRDLRRVIERYFAADSSS